MDKGKSDYRSFYAKGQGGESEAKDEYVEDNGGKYLVPYRKVRQVAFRGVRREELVDPEHAARLQYRLLLMEPILLAAVDFAEGEIGIFYNPEEATNRNERISLQGIVDFLAGEGVHVDPKGAESKEVDYYASVYGYYHDPKSIRERPPYGYTLDEWKSGMKERYEKNMAGAEKKKLKEWREWQAKFEKEHPELAKKQQ
jgi:hypothetical protein